MGHQYRGTDLKLRDAWILELRNPPNNMTLRQIAEVVEVSHVTVWNVINREMQKSAQPLANQIRELITAECMSDLESLRSRAFDGEPAAILAKQRVLSQLARTYGTDAPQVQQHDFSFQWKARGLPIFRDSSVIEGQTIDE